MPQPSQVGACKVAGIDINQPRMAAVLKAVTALAARPNGFRSGLLAQKVRELMGWQPERYRARHAAYDLKKLRGHNLVRRRGNRHSYEALPQGVPTLVAAGIIRDQILKPVLARDYRPVHSGDVSDPVEIHCNNLRQEIRQLCKTLKLLDGHRHDIVDPDLGSA